MIISCCDSYFLLINITSKYYIPSGERYRSWNEEEKKIMKQSFRQSWSVSKEIERARRSSNRNAIPLRSK